MPRSRRSKKFRRARLLVLLLVVLLVAGVSAGGWYAVDTVRASFPQVSGTVQVPGLSSSVQVKRDAQGIPQIYADTSEDLFKAQGYVQAQDRFWEMDVRRHITAGRLSEMFGSSQVDTDAFVRTMGWREVAQKEYDTVLTPETKKYLQAYSDGVNDWLSKHPGGASASLEYALLGTVNSGYKPEQWTPVDSVSWLKAMAWNLSGNVQDEIDRSLLSQTFTPDQINQLYPDYPYDRNPTITQGGTVSADGTYKPATAAGTTGAVQQSSAVTKGLQDVSGKMGKLPQLLGPQGQGIGSNSWVVSGSHTVSGKPLLANDPHLGPGLPNVWYQMGLHCRTVSPSCQYDTTGFTFAGMPGVIIGHNQSISWGFTNMGADVADLYLEKITGPDTYLKDNQDQKFATRQETIKVAGGADRTITVRSTSNGLGQCPLISDQSTEEQNVGTYAPVGNSAPDRGTTGYGVSLCWTALTPGKTMDAVFEFDKATDFTSFRAAAKDFAVPAQNLIYADTQNHIGYQAPGVIPVRGKGDGRYPAPGWDSSYDWKAYLDFKSLPWVEDPPSGYIVTANQPVADQSYKPLITNDWEYGTRAKEITDQIQARLANGGKISPDDMQSMQLDNASVMAKTLVPMLLKEQITDPYVRQAQDLLKDWNYNQDADSAAAAYYNGVWRQLLTLSFGQKFPASVRAQGDCLLVAQKVDANQPAGSLGGETKIVTQCGTRKPSQAQPDGGDRWMEVVRQQLANPNSPWWDYVDSNHVQQHGLDNLLKEAMKDARQDLTAHLGKDISTWSWGRLHQLTLNEQTLGTDNSSIASGLVHRLLNRGPYQMSGGSAAVDATGWTAAAGYDVDWIPSMRMVVDLNDFNASRWINVGGESGHAFNDNYDDQTGLWAQGKMLTWAYSGQAVDQATKNTLTLQP
ncbi:penicillin acylase family protein [Kitasatospora acidiphila]|uniref:Penicillin acylase family protein n=1 Tax=Kitasatospora acidiphila TaxID=2567942 RepID=A0A540W3Y2_9ACTN|nr:penicillin acylase family protein [Kitasatospora acidiphila]TQF03739.1 penicillin acylase family protein [Kitasatospora acidiphila]